MSLGKNLMKVAQKLLRQILKLARVVTKAVINLFLRSVLVLGRRSRHSTAGFVLPTVTMVTIVVVLLTTAIVIRSFDRSKNASNYRVSETVMRSAEPALDRAKAKLDALFEDPVLPRATPSDAALYGAFMSAKYNYGDETRLKLAHDVDGGGITADETLQTAWKYPVDTDNDGKFDSFTMYGVYFRNPPRTVDARKFDRSRSPLEARGLPMSNGAVSGICTNVTGTTASLVSGADWFQTDGKLKKAFFVYTVTVPIDATQATALGANYQAYKGNKGFSALEMQQDRARIPLNNNAVWYQDDIEIAFAPDFRLNGRVHTNSNLLVAGVDDASRVRFLQVSSPASCFYDPENSKIEVGGNVANGDIEADADKGGSDGFVDVHLYRGNGVAPNTGPKISGDNKTTTATGGRTVGFYSEAYAQRVGLMVDGAIELHDRNNGYNPAATPLPSRPLPTPVTVSNAANRFPRDVIQKFDRKYNSATPPSATRNDLRNILENYFKERTRQVPYAEIAYPNAAATAVNVSGAAKLSDPTSPNFVFAGAGDLAPPELWRQIEDPTSRSVANYTNLPLKFNGNNTQELETTDPRLVLQDPDKKENHIGDRIAVGNNLPTKFSETETEQKVFNGSTEIKWNNEGGDVTNNQRMRQSLAETLDDLGDTTRGGYWEQAAAKAGSLSTEKAAGGLRIVTGAGIYIDGLAKGATAASGTGARVTNSFLPTPPTVAQLTARGITVPLAQPAATNTIQVVWPDTMPMWNGGAGAGSRGDLQMRATAVYHYANGPAFSNTDQVPIACVSSYYDPTNRQTAAAATPSPATPFTPTDSEPNDRSNNGRVFTPPYTTAADRLSGAAAGGTYGAKLRRQANTIFPNGRLVNPRLRTALGKLDAGQALDLGDNAAIDAEICALRIDDGTATASPAFPANAVRERAFLDGRQVQALHRLTPATLAAGTTYEPNNPAHQDLTPVLTQLGDIAIADRLRITDTNTQLKTAYDLPLEQRQPLEIRVTEIDLGAIRTVPIGTPTDTSTQASNDQEYLFPNSGAIYASRNDALPDLSSTANTPANNPNNPTAGDSLVSASDYKLDPTRRPNGIRLINGTNLSRSNNYRLAEKGLIFASDLPVYVQGNFNLHQATGGGAVREEFNETSTTGNFYTRGLNGTALKPNRDLNLNFACRQGQTTDCTGGDQWRAATILSDAITLLSNGFRDGYRNQGDYDLRNNAGNAVVEARLKNGFWSNNFVTSANWVDITDNFPTETNDPTTNFLTSYLANGVTPIQRRVGTTAANGFPEYQMEICQNRKLLVSECGPQDWVQTFTRTIAAGRIVQINAGTTAGVATETIPTGSTATLPADADPNLLRYPRRVAFARDPLGNPNPYGALTPAPVTVAGTTNLVAQPIGIPTAGQTACQTGCLYPTNTTRTEGQHYGKLAANALWFATTNNETGNPEAGDPAYLPDRPLYYKLTERLLLPPAQIPLKKADGTPAVNFDASATEKLSDYAMCIPGLGRTTLTNLVATTTPTTIPTTPSSTTCPAAAVTEITALRTAFDSLTSDKTYMNEDVNTGLGQPFTIKASDIDTNDGVVVVDIDADLTFPQDKEIILDRGDRLNPTFVIRGPAGFDLTFDNNLKVTLKGVAPNNVFWVSNGGITFNGSNHTIAGNFIGDTAAPTAVKNNKLVTSATTRVIGGRFLGFNNVPGDINPATPLTAMTSTNQPLLLPVLQIHSPEGSPQPGNSDPFSAAGFYNNQWVQHVPDVPDSTTYNAVLVMGDTPSRPPAAAGLGTTGTVTESGGGLVNFPRFIEAWESVGRDGSNPIPDRTATIRGGLIQFKKSLYATAPLEAINPGTTDTSLFYDGTSPAYRAGMGSSNEYRYRGGASDRKSPFYRPPFRDWGFDVGLLSQSPDLFSQRFTTPPTGRPNEFFREVGRDDPWVKTLLCAAEPSGSNFVPAIATNERPADCATVPSNP